MGIKLIWSRTLSKPIIELESKQFAEDIFRERQEETTHNMTFRPDKSCLRQ